MKEMPIKLVLLAAFRLEIRCVPIADVGDGQHVVAPQRAREIKHVVAVAPDTGR